MQDENVKITQETVAEKLLWGLWRSVTEDYKCQYPRDIWDHYENGLRSASYTDSLKIFLTNFQRRIPINIQVQYNKDILSIVEAGEDDKVLNWLRSETTYLTMLVRLRNQERKEELKKAGSNTRSPKGMELDGDFSDLINKSKQNGEL